jgi:transposase
MGLVLAVSRDLLTIVCVTAVRFVAFAALYWGPVEVQLLVAYTEVWLHAAFVTHATAILPAEPEPVVALGIDETRRGAPRFALNPETGVLEQVVDRWHTGFVDLSGDQGLVGQVEGRSAADAGSWLAAQTERWREKVQVVAIDMCSAYRAAVTQHLPDATLVVRRWSSTTFMSCNWRTRW